jgi:hypothetical protein
VTWQRRWRRQLVHLASVRPVDKTPTAVVDPPNQRETTNYTKEEGKQTNLETRSRYRRCWGRYIPAKIMSIRNFEFLKKTVRHHQLLLCGDDMLSVFFSPPSLISWATFWKILEKKINTSAIRRGQRIIIIIIITYSFPSSFSSRETLL